MTTDAPTPFRTDASVRRVGQGLLDHSLAKAEWTHEAHLAACLWLLSERADIVPERDLPAIISSYNVAVGGENTDSAGYHETLTQLYVTAIRQFAAALPPETPLAEAVRRLLASKIAERDWPLRFYSRDRLFSVEARRRFVEPDLQHFG